VQTLNVSTNRSEVCRESQQTKYSQRESNSRQNETNFGEKRASLVDDFKGKNLNPNRLGATDYRFNRSTNLPKPQGAENELKHEVRKSESLKVCQKVISTSKSMNGNSQKISFACRSNLTPQELDGLKSLQKQVSNKELTICESDKSSRLYVSSRQQYLESGYDHCKTDLEIFYSCNHIISQIKH